MFQPFFLMTRWVRRWARHRMQRWASLAIHRLLRGVSVPLQVGVLLQQEGWHRVLHDPGASRLQTHHPSLEQAALAAAQYRAWAPDAQSERLSLQPGLVSGAWPPDLLTGWRRALQDVHNSLPNRPCHLTLAWPDEQLWTGAITLTGPLSQAEVPSLLEQELALVLPVPIDHGWFRAGVHGRRRALVQVQAIACKGIDRVGHRQDLTGWPSLGHRRQGCRPAQLQAPLQELGRKRLLALHVQQNQPRELAGHGMEQAHPLLVGGQPFESPQRTTPNTVSLRGGRGWHRLTVPIAQPMLSQQLMPAHQGGHIVMGLDWTFKVRRLLNAGQRQRPLRRLMRTLRRLMRTLLLLKCLRRHPRFHQPSPCRRHSTPPADGNSQCQQ